MSDSRIILALDGMSTGKALRIAEDTQGMVWGYKINHLLAAEGAQIIKSLSKFGRTFADAKLFDIPETMTNSLHEFKDSGADIVTVHVRAKYRASDEFKDMLAGVSVLTSERIQDLEEDLYVIEKHMDSFENLIVRLVLYYAKKVEEFGYGYMVCSAQVANSLKHFTFKTICPAIRPEWSIVKNDDQNPNFVATPRQAILNGADYLVVGRPITKSDNIMYAIERTNNEVNQALLELEKENAG